MDTKRLDSLFASWKKKNLLTNGALVMGRSWIPYVYGPLVGMVFSGFAVGVTESIFSSPHFPISIACGAVSFLLFVQMFPVKHFHKDRIEVFRLWGLVKRKAYYADLKKIVYSSFYDYKSDSWERALVISFKKMLCRVDRDFLTDTKFDCLLQLFSCYKPLFVNEFYYKQMVNLFAYMITLKSDPQYQYEETQFAVRYLAEVCGNSSTDYGEKLASGIKLYNAYRQEEDKLPAELGYVSVCLDILHNKGVCYADRLELLSALFECTYASDGMVDDVELDRLSRIAYYFRIKEWDFLSLKYSFETMKQQRGRRNGTENAQQRERYQSAYSNRMKEAYKILGLSEKATLDEVKSAYRAQVKSCHPDTLPPTAKESEREEATIRFRTITEAYDFLCAELAVEPVSVAR